MGEVTLLTKLTYRSAAETEKLSRPVHAQTTHLIICSRHRLRSLIRDNVMSARSLVVSLSAQFADYHRGIYAGTSVFGLPVAYRAPAILHIFICEIDLFI